jgi:hypothetical protein
MSTKRTYLTDEAKRIAVKTAATSRTRLLADLRSHIVTSAVKRAALGGEQDVGFEQSFASLAYAYVQERAPLLADYMVGFQLVDRNEDNTKAVGIFGFKVMDQWVYVPVFFMNGNLKGHELMYLKNQDTFVPLKENWVNYLLAKKPHVLGEPVDEDIQQLGGMEPDYERMRIPPEGGDTKYSMYVPPKVKKWASSVLSKLATWVTVNPGKLEKFAGLDDRLNLKAFISQDVALVKLAMDVAAKNPGIKRAIDEIYGTDLFKTVLLDMKKQAEAALRTDVLTSAPLVAVKRASKGILLKDSAADEAPKVEIIADQLTTENTTEMTESEREKLLRDGYLVRDHRSGEEVSVAYNTQVEMVLVNPDVTDVYEVLVKPGGFEKCLVIHHPHSGRGRKRGCVIVRLNGEKNWENIHQTKVFVKQQERSKSDIEEFKDWFEGVGSESTSLSTGATYVIITQNGTGTCAFEVREDLGDDCYRVSWEDYGGHERPEYLGDIDQNVTGPISMIPNVKDCDVICFNQREGASLKTVNGKMYIPPDAKTIKISDPPTCRKCKETEEDCDCDYFCRSYDVKKEPINPGNLADLQMEIMQKTSELKIWTDHSEVVINRQRMSKMAGLFHLIRQHNLREKQARRILKEALVSTRLCRAQVLLASQALTTRRWK